MKNITLILLFCCFTTALQAQFYQQYFDGSDTAVSTSILIQFDTSATNIWQVGPPQKPLFHAAHTQPMC